MIYWFWGYPGVGKDYLAEILSKTAKIKHIDVDDFLTKTDKRKIKTIVFTKKDRLKKLKRVIRYLNKNKENVAVADSLPDRESRQFLKNYFKKDIVFILVKSTYRHHRQRILARKNHFFTSDMLDQYIKKNWEPVKNFPHIIFKNQNKTKKELVKKLKKIYERYSKETT